MTPAVWQAGALAGALLTLGACSEAANETPQDVPNRPPLQPVAAGPTIPASNVAATRGERAFLQCAACHSMTGDSGGKIGPSLLNVHGRDAAALEGYAYSDALSASGLVWDEGNLDAFIEDPTGLVAGTKMAYAGSPDPDERANIIAYLKAASAAAQR